MTITVDVPEELASRLNPLQEQLPRILELGLREWHAASQAEFEGAAEVLETLAGLPAPEMVLAMRPSATLKARIDELLEKNRAFGLTTEEEQEWHRYQYLEHLVRMAKARAQSQLQKT